MSTAYLGLGSNLNSPLVQIQRAINCLSEREIANPIAVSSVYINPPYGPVPQADFLNAVIKVSTHLSPLELLKAVKVIESDLGRKASERWGPRSIDIDILLYEDVALSTPTLILPHLGLLERGFVLIPLLDIEPGFKLPDGKCLRDFVTSEMLSQMNKMSHQLQLCLNAETSPVT